MPITTICNRCGKVLSSEAQPMDIVQINSRFCEDCGPVCDFCSARPVVTRYPAHDIGVKALLQESIGDWAACLACTTQIEAGDRTALTDRALATYEERVPAALTLMPGLQDRIREQVTAVHDSFFLARTGPGLPIADLSFARDRAA